MFVSILRVVALTGALILPSLTAQAWRVDLIANWDPTLACTPSTCVYAVTPTVEVWLDTEGESDLALISFGVSFADTALAYDPVASSHASYLLYTASKAPYLVPAPICCELAPGAPDVVDIGFLSSDLPLGVPASGRERMAVLVFDALPSPSTPPLIGGVFDLSLGHVLQLGDTTTRPLLFDVQYAPEPGTGLLVGLGLAGLAASLRSRRPTRVADHRRV